MKRTVLALATFLISLCGCLAEKPVPPEVGLAKTQEFNLWRAGAPLYLQEPYAHYQEALSKAKDDLIGVNSKFVWFRDYKPVQAEFVQVLKQGDELFKLLEIEKQRRATRVRERRDRLRERLHQLDKLTLMINEGKVSRASLAKAEVTLGEADTLSRANDYLTSEEKLNETETYLAEAEKRITPVLSRYTDMGQITRWKKWANETIQESREKKVYSVLVIKAEKKLLLYKNGEPVKSYRIGLGQRGLSDKQRSKDHATPEGKYRIIAKNSRSRYYKALLINYPNEEDRREFNRAQKKGSISKTAKIGGSIEIHGGGNEGITYGCVSLDNVQMEELYNLVEVGTPVTIVGAVDGQNDLSSVLTIIQDGRAKEETP